MNDRYCTIETVLVPGQMEKDEMEPYAFAGKYYGESTATGASIGVVPENHMCPNFVNGNMDLSPTPSGVIVGISPEGCNPYSLVLQDVFDFPRKNAADARHILGQARSLDDLCRHCKAAFAGVVKQNS